MGIFSRRQKVSQGSSVQREALAQPVAESSGQGRTVQQLPAGSGLGRLVELMSAQGSGQLMIDLKQTGNDMNLGFFVDGNEKESTVVVPGSEWFDSVAALYTDEQKSERGAFNRALIKVDGAVVEASFINSASNQTHHLSFNREVERTESAGAEKNSADTGGTEAGLAVGAAAAGSGVSADSVDDSVEKSGAESADARSVAAPIEQAEGEAEQQEPTLVTAADLPTAEQAIAARTAREAEKSAQQEEKGAEKGVDNVELADNIDSADFSEEQAEETQPVAQTDSVPAPEDTESREHKDDDQPALPAHLDDDFAEENRDVSGNEAPAGAADGVADLPRSAEAYDVAPSYSKPAQPVAKPSTTAKAEGNLVLTEAEVVSRLADAQEALFGAEGTARDVSTVLIRIRSLGSYYDALTHVRSGGFWDQRKTFELIPEEVLSVLQLKADSYKEGFGSPLAMSLRFTPGIPPVASFDYSNEEAFVQYGDHLPAQQYVEELRMFPRTGSNIPEHMNEALTSWSF